MKIPAVTLLSLPNLLAEAETFKLSGVLATTDHQFYYLKVDDRFIHELFPLLSEYPVEKPDYFNAPRAVGAHITVVYPEEETELASDELGSVHHFLLTNVVAAQIGSKIYYVILAEAPSLAALRKKYGLPDMLCFKGYSIVFHITIGIHELT